MLGSEVVVEREQRGDACVGGEEAEDLHSVHFNEIMPVCGLVCMGVHSECSHVWQGCHGQMLGLGPVQFWGVPFT